MKRYFALLLISPVIFNHLASASAPPVTSYHLIHEIPIGGEGGWDYLSVDPAAHRLYLSQATRVVVVDLSQDKIAGEIPGTPGVHGFAIAHDLGRGYASNGKEAKVSVVDLQSLKTLSKVPTGENPDAILFEAGRQEVYAFNGRSKSVTVIDAKKDQPAATLPLPGKPEFAAADPSSHRVFVDIEDKSQVVAIDTGNHQIAATWPVAPGETPSAIAIDLARHHLFIGCENKKLILLDSQSGKVLSSLPIGGGVDAAVFDPQTGLVFSSNGEGNVTIAREHPEGKLELVQTLETRPGARTLALDPETHRIYLAAAQYDDKAPSSGEHRHKIVPGSIKLLVFGPSNPQ